MRKNKVTVVGCSVSDYTQVDRCYGDYLAEMLDFDYDHMAAGCGSNDRTLRISTSKILNQEIREDDILVVQYTNIHRREFYSRFQKIEYSKYFPKDGKATPLREKYSDGDLIKYKLGASDWQSEPEEKEFFELYENNFLSSEYDTERFLNSHSSFLALLEKFKIRTLFVLVDGYIIEDMQEESRKLFLETFDTTSDLIKPINITKYFENQNNCLEKAPTPPSHFSLEGHEVVAKCIFSIFKHLKI